MNRILCPTSSLQTIHETKHKTTSPNISPTMEKYYNEFWMILQRNTSHLFTIKQNNNHQRNMPKTKHDLHLLMQIKFLSYTNKISPICIVQIFLYSKYKKYLEIQNLLCISCLMSCVFSGHLWAKCVLYTLVYKPYLWTFVFRIALQILQKIYNLTSKNSSSTILITSWIPI